eukprot:1086287-Pelagomonas_calceolata.AAC.6
MLSAELHELSSELHKRVVGQNEAVNAVADAVLRGRAGLAARNRGASFLFLGPTGVGKTELAKALAALLFDDEKMMVRIDMGDAEGCLLPSETCVAQLPSGRACTHAGDVAKKMQSPSNVKFTWWCEGSRRSTV